MTAWLISIVAGVAFTFIVYMFGVRSGIGLGWHEAREYYAGELARLDLERLEAIRIADAARRRRDPELVRALEQVRHDETGAWDSGDSERATVPQQARGRAG